MSLSPLDNYTTEQLKRLTTLELGTVKAGEYVRDHDGEILLRTLLAEDEDAALINKFGVVYSIGDDDGQVRPPLRRVKSFDDRSQIDAPVKEMLAELQRRSAITNETHGGKHAIHISSHLKCVILTESANSFLQNGFKPRKDEVSVVSVHTGQLMITKSSSLRLLD